MIKKGAKWTLPHRVGHKDDIIHGMTRSAFMRHLTSLGIQQVRSPAQLAAIRAAAAKANAMRGPRKPAPEHRRAWMEAKNLPVSDSPRIITNRRIPRNNRHWQTTSL